MSNSIIVKGLVLSSFLTLIVTFVMYRSGKFDGYIYNNERSALQTSPNGGPVTKMSKEDSIKRRAKAVELLTARPFDTSASMRAASSKSMTVLPESELLPSSKSGRIFTPRPTNPDTIKKQLRSEPTPKK